MGKYSEKLLNSHSIESTQSGKYSSKLFGASESKKIYNENPYMEDTDEISTITAKPIQKPNYTTEYKPADFKTLMKAGFVDNNESKIKLFADARGIPTDRYEMKNGKIWFQGDDGQMYPETPNEISNLVKKFVAELPSELPADVGATAGAVSPVPGGAIAGAATGELIRKQIGKFFFGDDQKVSDYAIDMAIQGAFGALDSTVAKKLVSSLSSRKIKKTTGGKISNDFTQILGDLEPGQRIEGMIAKGKGKKIGVDLKPHQAMDDPTLTGYYSLLRDNPKTARAVRKDDIKLDKQVNQAGNDLIRKISDKKVDPFEVAEDLSKTATQAIDNMKKVRGDAVKGLYEEANKVVDVDVTPALEEITRLKGKVKPGMKVHSALNRLERMLLNKSDDIGPRKIPESKLEILDNVKQEIDAILNGKDASTITNKMKHKMQGIKDILTTQTDKQSREYQVARALFSAASPKIKDVEKSIVGVLSRMTTDEMKEKSIQKIFSSPQSIRTAKKYLEKENPELWKDTVAEFFRAGFDKASKSTQGSGGNVINRPGKYVTGMWDLQNQKKLKIAMEGMTDVDGNPLYNMVTDFFCVMKKASIGHGKESATQSRLKMEKDLQGLPGKLSTSMMNLRQAVVGWGLRGRQDKAFDKNAKKLLELMQTSEGVDLIAKAKGYGPKTEKGLIAATTLLLMSTESNAGKGKEIISTYLDQRNRSKSKKE